MNMTEEIIPRRGDAIKLGVIASEVVNSRASAGVEGRKPKTGSPAKRKQSKQPLWKAHRAPYRRFIARTGKIHPSLPWDFPINALVRSEQERRLNVLKAISAEPRLEDPEKQFIDFMCKSSRDGVFVVQKVMTSSPLLRLPDIDSHEEFLVRIMQWTVKSIPRDKDAIVYCNDTEFVERLHVARRERLRLAGYRDDSGHPVPNARQYAMLDHLIGKRRVSVRYPEPTYMNVNPYGHGFVIPITKFFNPSPR